MKVYKSKIDWWLIILILLLIGFSIVKAIIKENYIHSTIYYLLLLLLYFFSKTVRYIIKDDNLIIWNTIIDIKTIKKIYYTNSLISSPALSINRIAVVYNKYDEVLLSPKEIQNFIDELVKINPDIKVVI